MLLARLAGALAAPMQQMAGLLQALPRNLAYGLSALIEQSEAGGEKLPEADPVSDEAAGGRGWTEAPEASVTGSGGARTDAAGEPRLRQPQRRPRLAEAPHRRPKSAEAPAAEAATEEAPAADAAP